MTPATMRGPRGPNRTTKRSFVMQSATVCSELVLSKSGVAVLDGVVSLRRERNRLVVSDGYGRLRRERHFSRISDLRRLVILGNGSLTIDAIEWLAGVGVPWTVVRH